MLRVHCAVLNARTRQLVHTRSQSYGGHGERETPGNIPNPEAKPLSADGTALETGWESRTPPDITSTKGPSIRWGPSSFPVLARNSSVHQPPRRRGSFDVAPTLSPSQSFSGRNSRHAERTFSSACGVCSHSAGSHMRLACSDLWRRR